MNGVRLPPVLVVLLASLASTAPAAETSAVADSEGGAASAAPADKAWHGRIELKRENTSRGAPEESTKTTLRLESFFEGPVEVLRLDLPFPDDKTDFEGDPFDPRLGDVKIRMKFRPIRSGALAFPSFVELTFPTADPKSLGSGKYQVSGGLRMIVPLDWPGASPGDHKSQFETEVQQVNSFAGDSSRADINYTKFEFTLYDVWRKRYTTKLKVKPSVDWIQSGKTGTVGEVEAGLFFARHWRTWLMVGRRLSGPEGIKGTYDTRLELGLARTF